MIERCKRCRKEYEIKEDPEEIADYLCPHGMRFSRKIRLETKKPLDRALEKLQSKETQNESN